MMRSIMLGVTCLILSACASLTTPETPGQTVYATYGLYNAVSSTTATLLEQDQISEKRAEEIQSSLKDMRPLLSAARTAVSSPDDQPDQSAMQIVDAIQQRLQAIQDELEAKQNEHE